MTAASPSSGTRPRCGLPWVCMPATWCTTQGAPAPDAEGPGGPFEKVPELSRRARGVPVWAALKSLGRDGVAAQVGGLVAAAAAIAEGLAALDGVEVLNDVGYTQVCLSSGDDRPTRAVTARIIEE